MPDQMDYEKILEGLLEDRANLDKLIAWVQSKLGTIDTTGTSNPAPTGNSTATISNPPIMRFPRLREDTFFKMTVQEAIRQYLTIMKRPQSARAITDALNAGGLAHKAKDLYQTVFPTLLRMKEKGEVDKLSNGDWGLSEWYGNRKTSPEEKAEGE